MKIFKRGIKLFETKKKVKTKYIQFRVSDEEKEEIEKMAKDLNMTKSTLFFKLLELQSKEHIIEKYRKKGEK